MKKIDKDSFIDEVFEYGFFSELIPECFNSKALADNAHMLISNLPRASATLPTTMSAYKTNQTRRVISVPNPSSFVRTCKFIHNNWNEITSHALSKHSQSPFILKKTYEEDGMGDGIFHEWLNCVNLRDSINLGSNFVSSLKLRVRAALGYRYKLKLDLASFYDSIYTHAFTWAICGKEATKRYFINRDNNPRPPHYQFADSFDKHMQNERAKETNGIITGPFTSRIFSEILLSRIDAEIERKLQNSEIKSVFFRYVDDYCFYFRSNEDAEHSIALIEDILGSFRLRLNDAKTQISEYPFDMLADIKQSLKAAYAQDGMFGLLNKASLLHAQGEKGAYKYALKLASKKAIGDEEASTALSMLLNIALTSPSLSKYSLKIIENNMGLYKDDMLFEELDNLLTQYLNLELEQESATLLYFCKMFDVKVSGPNIRRALDGRCDLARIIALDYWTNNNANVIRSSAMARMINRRIKELSDWLSTESVDGEHWLLIYESHMHNLLPALGEFIGKTVPFFEKMKQLGISFYDGF